MPTSETALTFNLVYPSGSAIDSPTVNVTRLGASELNTILASTDKQSVRGDSGGIVTATLVRFNIPIYYRVDLPDKRFFNIVVNEDDATITLGDIMVYHSPVPENQRDITYHATQLRMVGGAAAFSGLTGQPTDNTNLAAALAAKQSLIQTVTPRPATGSVTVAMAGIITNTGGAGTSTQTYPDSATDPLVYIGLTYEIVVLANFSFRHKPGGSDHFIGADAGGAFFDVTSSGEIRNANIGSVATLTYIGGGVWEWKSITGWA